MAEPNSVLEYLQGLTGLAGPGPSPRYSPNSGQQADTIKRAFTSVGGRMKQTGKQMWKGMDTLDRAALTTSPVPIVGDVVGAVNDVRYLAEDPSMANAGFALAGLLPMVPSLGMVKAYHGTPHNVDKFRMDKIGTGEGAQVYGHGLYFSENPEVAGAYRDALSRTVTGNSGLDIATSTLNATTLKNNTRVPPSIDEAIGRLQKEVAQYESKGWPTPDYRRQYDEAINHLENWKTTGQPTSGNLYDVNIDVNHKDLLDWDKPLSEQSEAIQIAIKQHDAKAISGYTGKEIPGWGAGKPAVLGDGDPTGAQLYARLQGLGKDAFTSRESGVQASKALREMGIPGIRYLDQGSRGTKEGTRNLVIFDDSLISMAGKDVPVRVGKDMKSAQKLSSDHVNQLSAHLAEIWADEGGVVAEVLKYPAPAGYEKAWQAGIKSMAKKKKK